MKRSPRARYVRLEVSEVDGLSVIVPRRYDLRQLDDLLYRRASWILRKLEAYSQGESNREQRPLSSGDRVPYLGRQLCLCIIQADGNDRGIYLSGDDLLIIRSAKVAHPRLVEIWYRHEAARFIQERIDLMSPKLNVRCGRVTIRGQKTRWASCSPKGSLSFNWRLMMAPEAVVDYVIIHELAHLKEMNHTARFWRLVAELCPTWRENRRWLSDHGLELSAITIALA